MEEVILPAGARVEVLLGAGWVKGTILHVTIPPYHVVDLDSYGSTVVNDEGDEEDRVLSFRRDYEGRAWRRLLPAPSSSAPAAAATARLPPISAAAARGGGSGWPSAAATPQPRFAAAAANPPLNTAASADASAAVGNMRDIRSFFKGGAATTKKHPLVSRVLLPAAAAAAPAPPAAPALPAAPAPAPALTAALTPAALAPAAPPPGVSAASGFGAPQTAAAPYFPASIVFGSKGGIALAGRALSGQGFVTPHERSFISGVLAPVLRELNRAAQPQDVAAAAAIKCGVTNDNTFRSMVSSYLQSAAAEDRSGIARVPGAACLYMASSGPLDFKKPPPPSVHPLWWEAEDEALARALSAKVAGDTTITRLSELTFAGLEATEPVLVDRNGSGMFQRATWAWRSAPDSALGQAVEEAEALCAWRRADRLAARAAARGETPAAAASAPPLVSADLELNERLGIARALVLAKSFAALEAEVAAVDARLAALGRPWGGDAEATAAALTAATAQLANPAPPPQLVSPLGTAYSTLAAAWQAWGAMDNRARQYWRATNLDQFYDWQRFEQYAVGLSAALNAGRATAGLTALSHEAVVALLDRWRAEDHVRGLAGMAISIPYYVLRPALAPLWGQLPLNNGQPRGTAKNLAKHHQNKSWASAALQKREARVKKVLELARGNGWPAE